MNQIYQLTRKIAFLILAVSISLITVSCSGDEGEVGPKGDKGDTGATGPAGAKGDTGATGENGEKGDTGEKGDDGEDGAGVFKGGYIQGTLTGTRRDGVPLAVDFKLEYTSSQYDVPSEDEGGNWSVYITRSATASDNYSTTAFIDGTIGNKGTQGETMTATRFGIDMRQPVAGDMLVLNTYIEGSYEGTSLKITNYSRDKATSLVTFNFEIKDLDGSHNSTNHPLTITGSFSSGEGRAYFDVVGRRAN